MLLKNNINPFLYVMHNNKELNPLYYLSVHNNNKKNNNINNIKQNNFFNICININLSYNLIIKNIVKKSLNKKLKLKHNYNDKLKKSILNVKRTSLQLKNTKDHKFKLITCIGSGNKWIGIGKNEGKIFKKSFIKSVNTSKKYVYNLNFKCNDYKYLQYKGCKFRAINMVENKKNLKIYDNIINVSGYKKIKLISYSSKTTINIIKSMLNCF